MNEEKYIIEEVNRIKKNSKVYQSYVKTRSNNTVDEIGGHVEYFEKEVSHSICPSMDFVNRLLKKCAMELGVDK